VTVLNLSLEELYNGVQKKMKVTRRVVCKACEGRGSISKQSYQCSGCKGTGMKVTVTQLGPGRYAQQRGPCTDCNGSGENIPAKDRCKTCNGDKVVEDSKIIKVEIDKGSKEGKRVVFRGESDELPGAQAGDLIFVVKEKPHDVFKRDGVHLYMDKEIPLIEALTSTRFVVKHLDDRNLVVTSDDIIKPGEVREIQNEGMPIPSRPYQRGNLFIKFSIKFPDKLTPEQVKGLNETTLLPRLPLEPVPENAEKVDLLTFNPKDASQESYEERRTGEAYDDDDGMGGGGGQRVQCSQQ